MSSSEEEFVRQLRKQGIEAIFRRTDEGRIYGTTFIDRTERLVVNGSRLGKEFAARIWDEWSDGLHPEPVFDVMPAQEQSGFPNIRMEEGLSGMQPQQPPSLFEELLSAGAETFGELFEPLPPRYEEYIDPAFRLIRKKKKKKKHQIKH